MNIRNQVLILTAEQAGKSFESNRQATETMAGVLSDLGIPHKQTLGVFEGVENQSFVVVVRNQEELESIKSLAFGSFNQDAVLHQDANGRASLFYSNGTRKSIGKLEQVSSTDGLTNYTMMGGAIYTAI